MINLWSFDLIHLPNLIYPAWRYVKYSSQTAINYFFSSNITVFVLIIRHFTIEIAPESFTILYYGEPTDLIHRD